MKNTLLVAVSMSIKIKFLTPCLKQNQSVNLFPAASRTAEDNDVGPPSNRQRQELNCGGGLGHGVNI